MPSALTTPNEVSPSLPSHRVPVNNSPVVSVLLVIVNAPTSNLISPQLAAIVNLYTALFPILSILTKLMVGLVCTK
jgi:hypothetical protein